ncbi:hypothetical protein F5Y11DRAFT_96469 [Daldinia sp. FL1419]|nr:hypothetical protein F5Y11DRAFT_96469 [Daldinia sp. FL1419]
MRVIWTFFWRFFVAHIPAMWQEAIMPFWSFAWYALFLIISTYAQLLVDILLEKAEPLIIFSGHIANILRSLFHKVYWLGPYTLGALFVVLPRFILDNARFAPGIVLGGLKSHTQQASRVGLSVTTFCIQLAFFLLMVYSIMEIEVAYGSVQQPSPLSWAEERLIEQHFHEAYRINGKPRWRHTVDGRDERLPNHVRVIKQLMMH